MILDDFQRIGRDMFLTGLVSSHGGNMSIRSGDRLIITRRGAQSGQLTEKDIVETGLYEDDSFSMLTSSETAVHREIYLRTDALAIIHAHPRTAIALSLSEDYIVPADVEGSYLLHKIPVISSELASGPAISSEVADALKDYKIIMVRGHGCFATGQMLEEAYQWVSCLEEVSQIIYYSRTLGGKLKEFRRMADRYKNW